MKKTTLPLLNGSHLVGLDTCPLPKTTPFGITNVSMTQFSIARHFGVIKFNGASYTYIADTDELIRDDVLKWLTNQAKAQAKAIADLTAERGPALALENVIP